jgi:hypothetical protein
MSDETAREKHFTEDPEDSGPDLDFDEALGAAQGVVAYSNLDDYYFSGEKAFTFGVYTGYKYQCVEYARRYMLIRQKCIFGQCGPAAQIFDMTEVEHIETGEKHPYIACPNKTTKTRPEVGMTLVYAQSKKMPVGHVAVISYVDDTHAGIAEQNQESKAWNSREYGRLVPLIKQEDGTWYLKETDPCLDDCSGWLYIEGEVGKLQEPLPGITKEVLATVNDKTIKLECYPAPKVHEKFIAPPSLPKRMARFTSRARIPSVPEFKNAACDVSRESRRAIVEEYFKVLDERYRAARAALGSSAAVTEHILTEGPHFRRSGVARSPQWQSHYAPNEPLAIGGIGEGHRATMAVEQCVSHTLADLIKAGDAAVKAFAEKFTMPEAAVRAAASHLDKAEHGRASIALSAGDCLFGTLGIYYDYETDSNRLFHAELDSLNLLIDINAVQDQFSQDQKISSGWRNTSFGNDLHRAVKNFQKLRLGLHVANHPFIFLDFGDVAHLKSAFGFSFATDEEAYQYTIERLNHLYFAAALQDFLTEKKIDVEKGDVQEKDRPKWESVVVKDALNNVVVDGRKLTVGGQEALFAWKCAPWWVLFELADKGVAGAKALLSTEYANEDFSTIVQPLWTHIPSHPAFLPLMAEWAERHDRDATDGNAVSNRVIPLSAFQQDGSLPPRCSIVMPAHTGLVDPELPNRGTESPSKSTTSKDSPAPAPTVFVPATQLLLAGGKRAAGVAVEGRHDGTGEFANKGCDIYAAVHPAPLSFMPGLAQP